MKVEYMIYIYGAVCVCMMVFNIIYNMILKGSEPRMELRCQKIKTKIDRQFKLIKEQNKVEEEHLEYLRHSLCKVNNLIAFNRILMEKAQNDKEVFDEYLKEIRSVIMYIAVVYRDKENMQAGYFTYFISCYTASTQLEINSLQDILLDYVKKPNLYCRFNGLKALYHFARPEYIVEAIKIQDDGNVFFHEKLLTEGLLSYTGDHSRLIEILWKKLSSFSIHTQLAILNYIGFKSGDYKEQMFKIMVDKSEDKELRLSAIRYFGKYYYEDALKYLLDFVRNKDSAKWEYATVAAVSLSSYSGEEVIETLKEALYSGNWYIRYSAAQSLKHLNVDYTDIIDIAVGNDRYAREMMMYRLESRKLQSLGV